MHHMRLRTALFSALLVGCGCGLGTAPTSAQPAAPAPLDAQASDPRIMGWMVGAPPPTDKLIAFADGSWFRFPETRWSFSNIRQLMPTRVVSRGNGPVTLFARNERTDIDTVTFRPIDSTETTQGLRRAPPCVYREEPIRNCFANK